MVNWIPMKATMDRGGRVMLPAQVRAAMALRPGQRFRVRQVGDRIELEPEDASVRLEIAEDGLPVLVEEEPIGPVTLEQTIEDIHRGREERLDLLDPSPRS
jgi:AbrB family looped-hinge helix DNA binding protein